jgi:hypothetical protein
VASQYASWLLGQLLRLRKTAAIPNEAYQYLERMKLDQPQSFKEKLLQRVVVYALASVNTI